MILFLLVESLISSEPLTPVDYVNPYMGTISQILVPAYPTINLPNGMLRTYPSRADSSLTTMQAFPLILSSHRGDLRFYVQASATGRNSGLYDLETIKPYEYHAYMVDDLVDFNFAVSYTAGLFKFEFEGSGTRTVNFGGQKGAGNSFCQNIADVGGGAKYYVYADFSPAPKNIQSQCKLEYDSSVSVSYFRFGVSLLSYDQAKKNMLKEIPRFDYNQTIKNGRKAWNDILEKIDVLHSPEPRSSAFDSPVSQPSPPSSLPYKPMAEKDAADADLDEYNNRVKFYTSMYRVYERMVKISEDGEYYSAYNRRVNKDDGKPMYVDDWVWDTFRAAHPLRALIEPYKEGCMLLSYIRMAQQQGDNWLPTFPEISGDSHRMNGNHAVASIIDAYVKGVTNLFSLEDGYKAGKGAVTEKTHIPWKKFRYCQYDNFYVKNGYFPGKGPGQAENIPEVNGWEYRQCVAVTLAAAFDQWCLAQQARLLNKNDDYIYFLKRSYDFVNVFKEDTGFFHPKDNSGRFIMPFDYKFSGGRGARDYYDENNGWTYRWDCQHNIGHLVTLMGGPKKFVDNLDQTFRESLGSTRSHFYQMLPDQTGNVGQFTMANEPSLHIPFLYNFGLEPWKTQKRVLLLLKQWFRNDLYGIPGDEDGGGLSAFAVFAGTGIYPITPGLPVYTISTPLFPRVCIHVGQTGEGEGVQFEIVAEGLSATNKYIQSATLNGTVWNHCYIQHGDVAKGGVLHLVMGPVANRLWGSSSPPPTSEPYPG